MLADIAPDWSKFGWIGCLASHYRNLNLHLSTSRGACYEEARGVQMSLRLIHLRKLLKILYSEPNRRISALRSDIRQDIAREAGDLAGGGDFYGPFWRDAKNHAFGLADPHEATDNRIASNSGRANLYPRLRDGFLLWWNERRRWTNQPFQQAELLKTRYNFPGIDAVVKIDNILSVRDALGQDHFTYPYFSPEPTLSDEAGRVGLWLLIQALPNVNADEIRIIDVIRGQTFSLDRNPLRGDEQDIITRRYQEALDQWETLRAEYD